MTAPAHTCATCAGPLYPLLARRTDEGWVHARAVRCHQYLSTAARIEDIRWMVETGECLSGAATRLNTSADALDKWLRNHGMTTELRTLIGRDPVGTTWRERDGRRAA